ncbi:unnamed protein product [Brassicogethes aeneus]|uniref:CCHC-type domain-containing protein n=1 Tax=Brassicogethes aeneus TaxID=1431903 RepID=A0A9P0AT66_BRAAE|nr:unnamed protein product [Brassicogethes aeneus]
MATNIRFQEFNVEIDDWEIYSERLQQHFKAQAVKEEVQVPILLSLMGATTYKLCRDLCFPAKPAERTFDELNKLLKEHFCQKLSVWKERRTFMEINQQEEEKVGDFYARLCGAASECSFEGNLKAILKLKLVTGMKKGKVYERVIEEKDDATLDKILEIAKCKEKQAEEGIEKEHAQVNLVRKYNVENRTKQFQKARANEYDRTRSSNARDREGQDKMADYKGKHYKQERTNRSRCWTCGSTNHLARYCRRKRFHFIEGNSDDSRSDDSAEAEEKVWFCERVLSVNTSYNKNAVMNNKFKRKLPVVSWDRTGWRNSVLV